MIDSDDYITDDGKRKAGEMEEDTFRRSKKISRTPRKEEQNANMMSDMWKLMNQLAADMKEIKDQ